MPFTTHPRTRSGLATLGFLAALVAACSTGPRAVPATTASEALLTSLQVATAGDSVAFVLQVTNTSEAPISMEFSSGQTAEFIVTRGATEIWRWSNDQMFTQALRTETVAAGETFRVEAFWPVPAGISGQLQATADLLAVGATVRQTTTFAIP